MNPGNLEQTLSSVIQTAITRSLPKLGVSDPSTIPAVAVELEMPKLKEHGDISSTVALKIAKNLGRFPVEIALVIVEEIKSQIAAEKLEKIIGRVEIKEPGFINIFLHTEYLYAVMKDIQKLADRYGSSSLGGSQRVNIEFVSANPTGPLTVAHGRQAAFGDSLANILTFCGYSVHREYYVNDEGKQIDLLGGSIRARYRGLCKKEEEFPEDGYHGSYIATIAGDFKKEYGTRYADETDRRRFADFGVKWVLKLIKKDLKDFGVTFDAWHSQKEHCTPEAIESALALLRKKEYIYDKDQAVWFASTRLGDDKDRVVRKSDGSYTYLAPDIAYHLDKFTRKFDRLIDTWGPDHHGYVMRLKAAVRALGYDEKKLSILIVQLATIFRKGKPVTMSTRAGEFISLREVIDEVGKDVTRFCFLMRKLDSHLNFDLDVVKSQSLENPVYYIQYAHARICSIKKYGTKISRSRIEAHRLGSPEELDLLRMLRQFPVSVQMSAKALEPYIILTYLQQLAGAFHGFYDKQRVVSDDIELTKARLVLVECVQSVLANGLRLLGVSFPEKM